MVGQAGQIETFAPAGESSVWRDGDRFGVVTAIDFAGEFIIVADAQARCIHRYDADGKWLNEIRQGKGARGFMIPNGHLDFDVDSQGVIHAPNSGKHRIERFSPDGKFLGKFGRFGMKRPEDFYGCCNPTNLAVAPNGNIVVTEKAGPRVKVLNADGDLVTVVAADQFDENCKNMDVATDSDGRIYVVDTVRLNIHVFAPVE
jgi:sugar lactone lactonase YvrE